MCGEAEIAFSYNLTTSGSRPLSAAFRELARVRRNGQDSKGSQRIAFESSGVCWRSTVGPAWRENQERHNKRTYQTYTTVQSSQRILRSRPLRSCSRLKVMSC